MSNPFLNTQEQNIPVEETPKCLGYAIYVQPNFPSVIIKDSYGNTWSKNRPPKTELLSIFNNICGLFGDNLYTDISENQGISSKISSSKFIDIHPQLHSQSMSVLSETSVAMSDRYLFPYVDFQPKIPNRNEANNLTIMPFTLRIPRICVVVDYVREIASHINKISKIIKLHIYTYTFAEENQKIVKTTNPFMAAKIQTAEGIEDNNDKKELLQLPIKHLPNVYASGGVCWGKYAHPTIVENPLDIFNYYLSLPCNGDLVDSYFFLKFKDFVNDPHIWCSELINNFDFTETLYDCDERLVLWVKVHHIIWCYETDNFAIPLSEIKIDTLKKIEEFIALYRSEWEK